MAFFSQGVWGVMVKGVELEQEVVVSVIEEKLVEGEFFLEMCGNVVLIGQELVEKFNFKFCFKMVLIFQGFDWEIMVVVFCVVGIFDIGNMFFDGGIVFVECEDLNCLIIVQVDIIIVQFDLVYEVVLLLNDVDQVDIVAVLLEMALFGQEVKIYWEVFFDLELYEL